MLLGTVLILGFISGFSVYVNLKQRKVILSLQAIIADNDLSLNATTKREEISTTDNQENIISKGRSLNEQMSEELNAMKTIRKDHFEKFVQRGAISNEKEKQNSDIDTNQKTLTKKDEEYDGAF